MTATLFILALIAIAAALSAVMTLARAIEQRTGNSGRIDTVWTETWRRTRPPVRSSSSKAGCRQGRGDKAPSPSCSAKLRQSARRRQAVLRMP
jgi:hypothetical protein